MLACGELIRRASIDASSVKQESRDFSHVRFKPGLIIVGVILFVLNKEEDHKKTKMSEDERFKHEWNKLVSPKK